MSDTDDPHQRSLSEKDRAKLLRSRGLENYKTSYVNAKFPVLAFTYAIYGGGEHTLYCDFSEDFLYEYLFQHFGISRAELKEQGKAFQTKLPAYVRPLWEVLSGLYKKSARRTVMVEPDRKEIKVLLDAVQYELRREGKPSPVW